MAQPEDIAVAGLANGAQIDEQGWIVIPFGDSAHSGQEGRVANLSERTQAQIEAARAVYRRILRGAP